MSGEAELCCRKPCGIENVRLGQARVVVRLQLERDLEDLQIAEVKLGVGGTGRHAFFFGGPQLRAIAEFAEEALQDEVQTVEFNQAPQLARDGAKVLHCLKIKLLEERPEDCASVREERVFETRLVPAVESLRRAGWSFPVCNGRYLGLTFACRT